MKKNILNTLFISFILVGFSGYASTNQSNGTPDSVIMGQGYANDVYYSFENGIVSAVPRANWDIGIHTSVWSATIITNGGAGVNLYTYPKSDTTGWTTVDTSGLATWPVMYDSEESWEDGAFTRNAAGHPDYGWGKYNPVNHDVVGDSIYILKTIDNIYKKIWIQRKVSVLNTYYIRQANLDGSDDHVVVLDVNPYRNTNFIYYSFGGDNFVEREPDTASWDILFTKYQGLQPNSSMYGVVGVMNNFNVYSNEFNAIAPDFTDYASEPFDSAKTAIGWEWKTFDMGTMGWSVADSTAFFVYTRKGDVYKLVFTFFEGTSTGRIYFTTEPMSSGINDPDISPAELLAYPNPATERVSVDFGRLITGNISVAVLDLTGRQVYNRTFSGTDRTISVDITETGLQKGLHLMKITTGEGTFTSKFMVY